MDSAIVLTTFYRKAMPSNLLTVSEWRHFSRHAGIKELQGASWEKAARWWANRNGGAYVMKADDSLVVFTKRDGKVSKKTYKPGTYAWDHSDEPLIDKIKDMPASK